MRANRLVLLLFAGMSASGCTTLGYYGQAAGGELDILARSQPIAALLGHTPDVGDEFRPLPVSPPPDVKARLVRVEEIRDFATQTLALPDNDSYRTYADLGRPFVAWNVVATPEFSLTPKKWCFLVAGCVSYRGYFSQARARRFADGLEREGLDVRIAAVSAYSTLGWFPDPVLKSQLRRSDAELAGVIFHELGHQELYLPGDTAFNESFATTIALEGLRRWFAHRHDPAALDEYLLDKSRREQFVQLLLAYRARLETLYARPLDATAMRAAKAEIFMELHQASAELRRRWGGYGGYDAWFSQNLNNAHLASIGVYHQYVPAFEELLRRERGDLRAFYRAAKRLSRLPPKERAARLAELDSVTVAPGKSGQKERPPEPARPHREE
jgi:predicted aminopeptidase